MPVAAAKAAGSLYVSKFCEEKAKRRSQGESGHEKERGVD